MVLLPQSTYHMEEAVCMVSKHREIEKQIAKNKRVTGAVFRAVDEVNQQLPKKQELEKSVDTALIGPLSQLDSLGLVNLIVTTEKKIEEEFGVVITLADERAMSQANNPFETIGTLADYISMLLEEKAGG